MSDEVSDDPETRIAEAFDRSQDPLAAFEDEFTTVDVDPFELFVIESVEQRDLVETTIEGYRRVHRQWCQFMERQGRHPACPSERHVAAFIEHLYEDRDNHPNTAQSKLRRLNETYQFWQQSPAFPHPTDFNPISLAMSKVSFSASEDQKELPPLSMSEVRGVLQSIDALRDQLIIFLQLKLGLRASELTNIRIDEIAIRSATLREAYPELGSHWSLSGRPNTIFIPHDRDRNKSCRPRVLPLDEETRRLLEQYLYLRPDNGEPWLVLSTEGHNKLSHHDVNNLWIEYFRPMYEETKHHRAVGSHFGRHFFTTYWRIENGIDRQLLRYMRGDRAEGTSIKDRAGVDEYIHTYYEDVEDVFRNEGYQLLTG
ncbi:site-specific integrase [Natronomonas halophila]|uniref:tyrosine-type recombinase/integrase n=1 Tax=Natronomonas halophila TaxID=2747817 RepID=UPI0015B45E97|nr:site-specific integrase [Natronomonas halophila]QLD86189.1 site-specific integrase [Natronomonas halophila]